MDYDELLRKYQREGRRLYDRVKEHPGDKAARGRLETVAAVLLNLRQMLAYEDACDEFIEAYKVAFGEEGECLFPDLNKTRRAVAADFVKDVEQTRANLSDTLRDLYRQYRASIPAEEDE